MTLLLQVYGPGLALHGPSGSMARAAEVMLDEQRQVMIGFILMMVFFALSTVLCFWTAMDLYSASICTAVFIFAVRQWLYYWRRVYFKLFWDRSRAKRMFEDVKHSNSDEPFVHMNFNVPPNNSAASAAGEDSEPSEVSERPSLLDQTRKSLANMMTRPSLINPRPSIVSTTNGASGNADINNPMYNASSLPGSSKSIIMEGYLTKKTVANRRSLVAGANSLPPSAWERRYCAINGRKQLIAYKSRQEFRANEPSSLKERPLELEDYWIYFDTNIPMEDLDDTRSVVSSTTTSSKVATGTTSTPREMFRMTLISKDADVSRKFIYRCDTEEELEMWFDAVEKLLPQCIATSDNINSETMASTNPALFDPNQHVQGMSTVAPSSVTDNGGASGSNLLRNSFRASFSLGGSFAKK
jgi:heme/copper-type cytochrome/quinol oxidase subunit 4